MPEKKLSPPELYEAYFALKFHFTNEKFDYFKYAGKSSRRAGEFDKSKHKLKFVKLYNKYRRHAFDFMLVNMSQERGLNYIGNLVDDPICNQIYNNWVGYRSSLTYNIKQDFINLTDTYDSFNGLFRTDGEIPALISLYMRKDINFELFAMLCDLTQCLDIWDKKIVDSVVYPKLSFRTRRYLGFLDYDRKKISSIIRDVYA